MANLVTDGGIEAFTAGAPDNYEPAGFGDTLTQETTIVHGGANAVYVEPADPTNHLGIRNKSTSPYTLAAATAYDFSCWVRVPSGDLGNNQFFLNLFDSDFEVGLDDTGSWSDSSDDDLDLGTVVSADTYVQLTFPFDTNTDFGGSPRTDLRFRVWCQGPSGPRSFYIDDIVIEEAGASEDHSGDTTVTGSSSLSVVGEKEATVATSMSAASSLALTASSARAADTAISGTTTIITNGEVDRPMKGAGTAVTAAGDVEIEGVHDSAVSLAVTAASLVELLVESETEASPGEAATIVSARSSCGACGSRG